MADRAGFGHRRGLDGVRALAVIAVVVYHINPSWLPGGFFGVDVFFVVSGYLITSLLVQEWQRTGSISLRRFWIRRARRLLPALVALLAGCSLLAAVFAHDAVDQLRTDVPAAMGYVTNWWLVFHRQSYFQSIGRPPLLLHLWSLAVEEQFYLLWPLVVIVVLRLGPRGPAMLRRVALTGAIASSVAMALLYHPAGDPSRIYFGTDTHAQGILIGAALALTVPPWRMRRPAGRRASAALDAMPLIGLAGLGLLAWQLGQYSETTYRGGFVAVDCCAALVVIGAMHPFCRVGALLGREPLRWVGSRSYAIYLWHWPILELTRPNVDVQLSGAPLLVLRLALIVAAAELSYRLVEAPWRARSSETAGRPRVAPAAVPEWRFGRGAVAGALSGAAGVTVLALALTTVPAPTGPLAVSMSPAARQSLIGSSQGVMTVPPTADPAGGGAANWRSTRTTPTTVATSPADGTTTPPTSAAVDPTTTATTAPVVHAAALGLSAREPILAIGDSVLLATSPALESTFGPGEITVDAVEGRQVSAGLDRLAQYQSSGQLATFRSVIIDLGTNGTFTPQEFARLVSLTAGVPLVVVVTAYADRPWISTTNATIEQGASSAPNLRIADWASLAAHDTGLLYSDGVHPNATGAERYAVLMQTTLSA